MARTQIPHSEVQACGEQNGQEQRANLARALSKLVLGNEIEHRAECNEGTHAVAEYRGSKERRERMTLDERKNRYAYQERIDHGRRQRQGHHRRPKAYGLTDCKRQQEASESFPFAVDNEISLSNSDNSFRAESSS